MIDLIILLVEYLRQHSLWLLGILIVLQNNGVPFNSSIMVMTTGVLAYYGEFSLTVLWVSVWLSAVLGDSTSFWLWRKAGPALIERFPRLKARVDPALETTERYQNRYGQMTVFLSRFPFSALGTFVNIFAAMSKFNFPAFLASVALGQLLWASFYLALGYWFGDYWEQVSEVINNTGRLGILLLALIIVMYFIARHMKMQKAGGRKG